MWGVGAQLRGVWRGAARQQIVSSPFLRRAVRNSMGDFQAAVIEELDAKNADELRTCGVRCIAAHPGTSPPALWQADFSPDSCVVFGSEGYGFPRCFRYACVAIPMFGQGIL
jgi:tRNA G18 (ribose-2'-O)-methylase SpoU